MGCDECSDESQTLSIYRCGVSWQHRPFAHASPGEASSDVYEVALLDDELDDALLILAAGADGSFVLWKIAASTGIHKCSIDTIWHGLRTGPIHSVAMSRAGLAIAAEDRFALGTMKLLVRDMIIGDSFEIDLPSSRSDECINPSCDATEIKWDGQWQQNCLLCTKSYPLVNAMAFSSDSLLFYGGYGKQLRFTDPLSN